MHWREEVLMENKHLSPKDLNYLNVPYSIINQRWFRSEKAVRAWFFYAWHALFPESGKSVIKTIRKEKFNLKQGEMICTRSYLAKSLGIEDSAAKSSTDKLKRTGTIKVTQEVISKDIEKAPKNKLSRIMVDGVPVPNEPYIKMPLPIKADLFWQEKVLAQIYIYLMCKAEHKEVFGIGTGHSELLLKAGDVLTSYATLIEDLRCTEYQVKKYLSYFEKNGTITRQRVGNGILVHLNYYPQPKVKPAENDIKKDSRKEDQLQQATKPTNNHQNAPQQGQSDVAQRTVVLSPTPSSVQTQSCQTPGDNQNNAEPLSAAIWYYHKLRGWKNQERTKEIVKLLSPELKNIANFQPCTLEPLMRELYEKYGNDVRDERNKSVLVDHVYLRKYIESNWRRFYKTPLEMKQDALRTFVADIKKSSPELAAIIGDIKSSYFDGIEIEAYDVSKNSIVLRVPSKEYADRFESNISHIAPYWKKYMRCGLSYHYPKAV